MPAPLTGKTVAFLSANEGVEEVELTRPWEAVRDAGGTPRLLAPESGDVLAFNHLDKSGTYPVDEVVSDAAPGDFDALVLPGGVANADELRIDADAVAFVDAVARSGKPIAVICHAPWTLIETGALRGRTLTSWPTLATDVRNAGATWVDEEVHIDRNGPGALISSRGPDDLDAFCRALVGEFAGAASAA